VAADTNEASVAVPGLAEVPCRVVVLAPLGRDAAVVKQALAAGGVDSVVARDMVEVITRLREVMGVVLVTEEALAAEGAGELTEMLQAQPSWSDLPVLLLLASGDCFTGMTTPAVASLRAAGNVTVMERPIAGVTLVTAVHSALRARRRQYELRELLGREQLARREAEEATRVKDEFLATVSHELRTPLSAILLWGNLLGSGRVDTGEALQAIERSARAQSQLIEDLLDISRMRAGKLRVRLRECQLAAVARAALEVVQPMAEVKGVRLDAYIDPDVGVVLADPDRMQQVLWNLLSNAVKFTPAGGRVSLRLWGGEEQVRVRVSDTGIGIRAEFLPHVFERFRQADATTTRQQGGLGLGLAIARQLVELHGGTLAAESAGEGMGATFTVALPLLRADITARAVEADRTDTRPPTQALAAVRVLLVEDEPDTRRALARVLMDAGAEVQAVDSAAAAWAVMGSFVGFSTEGGPQVLVIDIGLPGEDGNSLIRRIRAQEAGHGRIPVIPAVAISAYLQEEGRARALSAGFDDYLVKPIMPDALVAAVQAVVRRQTPL